MLVPLPTEHCYSLHLVSDYRELLFCPQSDSGALTGTVHSYSYLYPEPRALVLNLCCPVPLCGCNIVENHLLGAPELNAYEEETGC